MRLSVPMANATCCTSAPVASQSAEMALTLRARARFFFFAL